MDHRSFRSSETPYSRGPEVMDTVREVFGSYSSPAQRGFASGLAASPPSQASKSSIQREIVRIHELWQKSKSELAARDREIAEWKNKYQRLLGSELSRSGSKKLAELETLTMDLKDKLRFVELQLSTAREENERWMRSNEELQAQLEQQAQHGDELQRTLRDVQAQLHQATERNEALVRKSLSDERDRQEVLAEKDKTIRAQDGRLHALEGALSQLRQEAAEARDKARQLEEQGERQQERLQESRRMVQTATEDVKQNRALQLRVSQLQVQVDHLKIDNSRLVRLLSTTAEYQEFRHFFRDSGGAATYMHSRAFARSALPQPARSPARSRSASPARGASSAAPGGGAGPGTARLAASALSVRDLEEGHGARAADGEAGEEEVEAVHWEELPAFMEAYPPLEGDHPVSARSEMDNWLPLGAAELTDEFRAQHLPHVPPELLTEFLRQLNQYWREREAAHVQRVRARLQEQVRELKRKWKQSTPYELVMNQRHIERLRTELLDTRSALLKSRAARPATATRARHRQQELSIERSLATVESLSRQVAAYAEENRQLQARLQSMLRLHGDPDRERAAQLRAAGQRAFADGAMWAVRSVMAMVERANEQVQQLVRDFKLRTLELNPSDEDFFLRLVQLQSEYVDKIENAVHDAVSSVRRLRQLVLDCGGDREQLAVMCVGVTDVPPPPAALVESAGPGQRSGAMSHSRAR